MQKVLLLSEQWLAMSQYGTTSVSISPLTSSAHTARHDTQARKGDNFKTGALQGPLCLTVGMQA